METCRHTKNFNSRLKIRSELLKKKKKKAYLFCDNTIVFLLGLPLHCGRVPSSSLNAICKKKKKKKKKTLNKISPLKCFTYRQNIFSKCRAKYINLPDNWNVRLIGVQYIYKTFHLSEGKRIAVISHLDDTSPYQSNLFKLYFFFVNKVPSKNK